MSRLEAEGIGFYRIRLGFISLSLRWKPIIWTLDQLRYWPSLAVGYLKAIRAEAPNAIVHTNWHHALLLLPFLDRRRDIYWSHEIVARKRHYGWVFRAIADRVALIVCVSNAVADRHLRNGVPAEKLVVIHNGITIRQAETSVNGRDHKRLRIGIVGQIGPWKGHDDLVEAFGLLAARYEALTLIVFGKLGSEYVDRLKARIEELGLQERTTWAGFVDDLEAIYRRMDICVVPSRVEDSLPTTAIEAGHFGLPVVATSRGGLPEIIDDGVTGLLVPSAAPQELAYAIGRLIRDSELRRRMGRDAVDRMRRLFSDEQFVDSFHRTLLGLGSRR